MIFFYKGHLIVSELGYFSVRIDGQLFSTELLSDCVGLVNRAT